MSRPEFITEQDLARWLDNINQNSITKSYVAVMPELQEVIYAGLWLAENLALLKCNPVLIARIRYTAGQLSFGKDAWDIHQEMLHAYRNNELEFEIDYDEDEVVNY